MMPRPGIDTKKSYTKMFAMCAKKGEKTLAISEKLDAHYMSDPWRISRVLLIKK